MQTRDSLAVASAVSGLVGATAAVAVLSLQAFDASPGVSERAAEKVSPALQRAIDAEQARGLICQSAPASTDVVLFGTAKDVRVLTFDKALEATAAGEGTGLRYCR